MRARRGAAALVVSGCALAGAASLHAEAAHADISIYATGIEGAENLRLLPDGTLLLDAPGKSLIYRLTPRDDGAADVWLIARELQQGPAQHAHPALAVITTSPPVGEADLTHEPSPTPAALRLTRKLDRICGIEAVLGADAAIYVNSAKAGVVYRISIGG
jgi:hypothetical protein